MSMALLPSGSDQPHGNHLPATHLDRLQPAVPLGLRRPINLGTLVAAAIRRWKVAAGIGLLLGAAFASADWFLRPEKYTSFALVRVASTEQTILKDPNRSNDPSNNYTRTQLALLKSRGVIEKALTENIRQLPLMKQHSDPIDWLDKELIAEQIPNTEILRLSLTARGSGADLATIVNAITTAYLAEVERNERGSQETHLKSLEEVYSAARKSLTEQRENLRGLTTSLKNGDPKILGLKQQALLDISSMHNRDLASIKSRIREVNIKIATYKLRLGVHPAQDEGKPWWDRMTPAASSLDLLVEKELDADPRVAAAEAAVAIARNNFKQAELGAAQTGTWMATLRQRLNDAQAAAKAVRDERREVVVARQQSLTETSARQLILEAEAELLLLIAEQNRLTGEVENNKRELESIGINTADLEIKRGEIERSEQFLSAVGEQKERLTVELNNSTRKRVTVIYKPTGADVLSKLAHPLEAAGAGVAGLLMGIFAIAFRDLRRNQIHCPSDVSNGLRLRVIGALPKMLAPVPGGAPLPEQTRGLIESIDALRTTILSLHSGPRGAALLVASAKPAEGKTTLAMALAASLARARRRTLLIDCDLRAPSLHRVFGLEQTPGLSEVFAGTAGLKAAIRPTVAEYFDLMPAGELSASAAAGLAEPNSVRRLIDELRSRYDFVVIDSSPILLVPDALMVAGSVDGLLYSVRPGVSTVSEVHAGYERVCVHRVPFLGVVVNGVPLTQAYAPGYGRPLYSPAPAPDSRSGRPKEDMSPERPLPPPDSGIETGLPA
jgi:capsular exopolysaccharide synthesis family protein